MFTGLVEAKGALVRRVPHGTGDADARLTIRGQIVKTDAVVLGESIAVDGVCLTVAHLVEAGGPSVETVFDVVASSETLALTTLGSLAEGSAVNLERALLVTARLGGHIVSGHVDGVGSVVALKPVGESLEVTFEAPKELANLIATKGSICVNGVSLTVNGVQDARFHVMLIPHTRANTSLDSLGVGSKVNLEVDVLARYVARLSEKI